MYVYPSHVILYFTQRAQSADILRIHTDVTEKQMGVEDQSVDDCSEFVQKEEGNCPAWYIVQTT